MKYKILSLIKANAEIRKNDILNNFGEKDLWEAKEMLDHLISDGFVRDPSKGVEGNPPTSLTAKGKDILSELEKQNRRDIKSDENAAFNKKIQIFTAVIAVATFAITLIGLITG